MRCFTSWIRLDDKIRHHKKFLTAGPAASWLWVCALSYAQEHLTDGFISDDVLPMLGIRKNFRRLARVLVKVRLFDKANRGYQIHDYLHHNASKVSVISDRKWDQFRKELYGVPGLKNALLSRDRGLCRYCRTVVNWTDRRGPGGGVFTKINPNGDTVLANVVTCCRRCLQIQDQVPSEPLPLFPTGTSSDLVQNQVGPSSELSPRARASFPSHPISTKEEVHTHTGAAGASPKPPPASPLRTPPPKKPTSHHPGNAWSSSQPGFYVTQFLHEEFMAQLGSHADEAVLMAWYAEVDARRQTERPAIGSIMGWWRDEFRKWLRAKEWTGATSKRSSSKRHASDWFECKHDPPCPNLPNLQEHKRLVEAERSGRPEAVKLVLEMHAKHWPIEARSSGKGGMLH